MVVVGGNWSCGPQDRVTEGSIESIKIQSERLLRQMKSKPPYSDNWNTIPNDGSTPVHDYEPDCIAYPPGERNLIRREGRPPGW